MFFTKPGKDPRWCKNHRPISLLNYIGKIYGKLLNRRVVIILTRRDLYNIHQDGFRPGRGTQTSIAMLWECIVKGVENKLKVSLTSRDVEKAFDRVWLTGLKFKLSQLGFSPPLLRVLCNYLDDRVARISINGEIGEEFPITCGVPQGGCLSATLYALYTRDIPPPIYPWTQDKYYADDITQTIRGTNYNDVEHVWCAETSRVNEFEKDWLIKTNPNKFKMVNIQSKKPRIFRSERLDVICESSNEVKVLGMTITSHGISKHIANNIQQAKNQLYKIKRFKNLSMANKRKLYLMLVRSKLIYPCIPLHATNNSQMLKLQRVQNRGINFILGHHRERRDKLEDLHRWTNLKPINVVLQEQATKTWTKIINTYEEESITNLTPQNRNFDEPRPASNFPSSLDKKDAIASPFYRMSDPRWVHDPP